VIVSALAIGVKDADLLEQRSFIDVDHVQQLPVLTCWGSTSCECRGGRRPRQPRHVITSFTSPRAGDQVVGYNPYIVVGVCHSPFISYFHYTLAPILLANTLHSNHGWRTTTLRWPDGRRHRRWRRTRKGICTLLRLARSQRRGQRLGRLLQGRGRRHQGKVENARNIPHPC
jgi:hypothetical protein